MQAIGTVEDGFAMSGDNHVGYWMFYCVFNQPLRRRCNGANGE